MKQHASVEIGRPIDEVFDYTVDHVAEWSNIVVEETMIEEKQGRVGSTFHNVTEDHGQRMEFQGTVTRHEPPNISACHLTGDSFDIDVEYIFEELGGQTRVSQHSDVTPKGLLRVFFFLFGWLMRKSSCKAAENELLNLKRLLEEGAGETSD